MSHREAPHLTQDKAAVIPFNHPTSIYFHPSDRLMAQVAIGFLAIIAIFQALGMRKKEVKRGLPHRQFSIF